LRYTATDGYIKLLFETTVLSITKFTAFSYPAEKPGCDFHRIYCRKYDPDILKNELKIQDFNN
jgi:hypothetical protein